MKLKAFFFVLFLLSFSFTVSAQTVYLFEYKFQQAEDQGIYQVFFVTYDDGSGTARIKYRLPGSAEIQLLEMQVQGQYVSEKAGIIDTNKYVYKTSNPVTVLGNSDEKFRAPFFWFKKNQLLDIFEPVAVSDSSKHMASLLKSEYIQNKDLKKDLVTQYFSEKDAIYQNLFGLRSRGLSAGEKNSRIFLLVVANTNDPVIGSSCNMDMNRIVQTFQDLADFLDIKFYPTTIFGNSYNKLNVENAILNLKPASNDIVVFYYSGHGFRKKEKPNPAKPYSRYPFLDFRSKPGEDYNLLSLNIEDIFNKIKRKGARLNLVLSDCCNNLPESTNSEGDPIPKTRGSGLDWVEDNCRTLFLNPKRQSVLATAADVGQLASSNNKFGGFFSYFFKTSMETHFSTLKTNVSWELVLEEAVRQTDHKAQHTYCSKPYIPENICKQNPFYNRPSIFGSWN